MYLYPKSVDFRKSIVGLAALVELNIKVAVFDPVLFVFSTSRATALYWERNGFCLWLKRLESERFKTSPDGLRQRSKPSSNQFSSWTVRTMASSVVSWLRPVLERLPHASSVADYEALLPWNCSPEVPR